MKVNSRPANEAVLSNVGQVGEFRIRNSSKAFSILSSGIYANKIRAIIRELSCNAHDSHKAADNLNTPFDVHLPSSLEPWFSIRDYGTGLNHDEVTNIFTTYFESTKTDSNDFIGALGLGSKSPFSYVENFTVVAIKDGRKGVYTAFINQNGVPSIALMTEQASNEPNGVEIRFSVEVNTDFSRFRNEAAKVYKYFKHRPVVTAVPEFQFIDPSFVDRDIAPGVHSAGDRYGNHSVAVMGNIDYPIEVPNRNETIGELSSLLDCGLVMEFEIGELDIQASREGLSYIDITIQAIKRKLEMLNANLTKRLADDANKFTNLWERAFFLADKGQDNLWYNAVTQYVADTKFALINTDRRYIKTHIFTLSEQELNEKYNIVIKAFSFHRSESVARKINTCKMYHTASDKYVEALPINVLPSTHFVINDTKIGAQERTKYHWKNTKQEHASNEVYVLEAFDKEKPVKHDKFFEDLSYPPEKQICVASKLLERPRITAMQRDVSILYLAKRDSGYYARSGDFVWRAAGNLEQDFTDTTTYYYLPLKGFKSLGTYGGDMRQFLHFLHDASILDKTITVHGVRKSDIDAVKAKSNWVNLDDFVVQKLSQVNEKDYMEMVKASIDFADLYCYNAVKLVNEASPYVKFYDVFKDIKTGKVQRLKAIEILCTIYNVSAGNVKFSDLLDKYKKEIKVIIERYPLLNTFNRYDVPEQEHVAEYINAIDHMKGI